MEFLTGNSSSINFLPQSPYQSPERSRAHGSTDPTNPGSSSVSRPGGCRRAQALLAGSTLFKITPPPARTWITRDFQKAVCTAVRGEETRDDAQHDPNPASAWLRLSPKAPSRLEPELWGAKPSLGAQLWLAAPPPWVGTSCATSSCSSKCCHDREGTGPGTGPGTGGVEGALGPVLVMLGICSFGHPSHQYNVTRHLSHEVPLL